MDQYKSEGTIDVSLTKPTTISEETRQVQSIESTVRRLQDTINIQQQEIAKLQREVIRLKHGIDDVINMVRNRG